MISDRQSTSNGSFVHFVVHALFYKAKGVKNQSCGNNKVQCDTKNQKGLASDSWIGKIPE